MAIICSKKIVTEKLIKLKTCDQKLELRKTKDCCKNGEMFHNKDVGFSREHNTTKSVATNLIIPRKKPKANLETEINRISKQAYERICSKAALDLQETHQHYLLGVEVRERSCRTGNALELLSNKWP